MKTLKSFLEESSHYGFRTTALLPTGTKLHPGQPHKNEFHAGWDDSHGGSYILAKKRHTDKHVIIYGHGTHNVGDTISAHHDQTMKRMGDYEVVHKTSHKDVGSMPIKKSHPLWVYK